MNKPTRSTIARLIRYGQKSGTIDPATSPVGKAAYVRGFLRGRAVRLGRAA